MEFLNFSDQKEGHVHQIIHNVNRILIPKADKIKFQPYLPERVLYVYSSEVERLFHLQKLRPATLFLQVF